MNLYCSEERRRSIEKEEEVQKKKDRKLIRPNRNYKKVQKYLYSVILETETIIWKVGNIMNMKYIFNHVLVDSKYLILFFFLMNSYTL